jgi:hypothetical protein
VQLSNGNYVVRDSNWSYGVGAVTFGSGMIGVSGVVNAVNSLVGSTPGDQVGGGGITVLSNGNYVVRSQSWSNGMGAVTFGSGVNGITGVVSIGNSLVGSATNDHVGIVTPLGNGNYVVSSPIWSNGTATTAGAVTFGSGTSGVKGVVSAANSLVGSSAGDELAYEGIKVLSNGNYLVISPLWSGHVGAVTFGSGVSGVSGVVSAANSLVGSTAGDFVGFGNVTVLSSGNYVVDSPSWSNGVGAVTWGSGMGGISGLVSDTNSLVGSSTFDAVGLGGVTALKNGNYVVTSDIWSNGTGAVTFGSGTSGISGVVSAANSLVGSTPSVGFSIGEEIGVGGVTALSNGNYVVVSQLWSNGSTAHVGAVTFGSGTSGVSGIVSAANSLVGSSTGDVLGYPWGVTALGNGNYVVDSPYWSNGVGAVSWGSGISGINGVVSAANSLVGSVAGDSVGSGRVVALSNGNFVVSSPSWSNGAMAHVGAVTFGSGASGISGVISAANSLIGSSTGDSVGNSGVTVLSNGNYLVSSQNWSNGPAASAGAVTFGSGATGISGVVSAANSLVGSTIVRFRAEAEDLMKIERKPVTK